MSKKDYEALAKALHSVKPDEKSDDQLVFEQWLNCVHAVAKVCDDDNQNFKWGIFLDACNGK